MFFARPLDLLHAYHSSMQSEFDPINCCAQQIERTTRNDKSTLLRSTIHNRHASKLVLPFPSHFNRSPTEASWRPNPFSLYPSKRHRGSSARTPNRASAIPTLPPHRWLIAISAATIICRLFAALLPKSMELMKMVRPTIAISVCFRDCRGCYQNDGGCCSVLKCYALQS